MGVPLNGHVYETVVSTIAECQATGMVNNSQQWTPNVNTKDRHACMDGVLLMKPYMAHDQDDNMTVQKSLNLSQG